MSYCKTIVLKDKKSIRKDGTTNVYVQYVHDGKILRISTGERVHPQHFKNGRITKGYDGDSDQANANVEIIRNRIDSIIRNANFSNAVPTIDYVRNKYGSYEEDIKNQSKDLIEHLQEYIDAREHDYTFNSIKDFKTLLSHLKRFKKHAHYNLALDNLNGKFLSRFSQYLFRETEQPLMTNTVAKQFKSLKTALNYLTDEGWNTNLAYKKFKVNEVDPEIIHLTREEVGQIIDHKFKNRRLEQVADMFLLSVATGLRHSDLKQVTPEKIQGDYIVVRTIKTKDNLMIPLNDISKDILNKYFSIKQPLPVISNQKSNDYLKEMGKEVGLNRIVNITKYYGRERLDEEYPLHRLLTTHVGRKTFVTLSLEFGMRPEVVMKITGHSDFKTMKKYLAVTNKSLTTEMVKWDIQNEGF